jgi:hypothetical protein
LFNKGICTVFLKLYKCIVFYLGGGPEVLFPLYFIPSQSRTEKKAGKTGKTGKTGKNRKKPEKSEKTGKIGKNRKIGKSGKKDLKTSKHVELKIRSS